MDRRSRRAVRALLCAAVGALTMTPAAAYGQVTTDLVDWNLTETATAYGGGTHFHISSSGDGSVAYRWLDSPDKTTVIAAHGCTDGANLGGATIGIGDTSYKTLFSAWAGVCFIMRGRTAIGSGSLVNHDGRVKR